MYPLVLDSIKQHEIINGYNNCNKNDKSCCEFHTISSYKYIVLSIQKEINFEAKLRLTLYPYLPDFEQILIGYEAIFEQIYNFQ
jgi:hypothetical protein